MQKPAPKRPVAAFGGISKPTAKPKPKPTKEEIDAGIRRFIEKANETCENDYAAEEDDDIDYRDEIPDEALMELAQREEEDPENFSILRPEARRRMEEREETIRKLTEKHSGDKRKGEQHTAGVSFEDAIEAQLKTHKLTVNIEPPKPGSAKKEESKLTIPAAAISKNGFEMPKDNLMIYRDPETSTIPDRLVGRKPLPLSLIDKDMLPATPESLLPDIAILNHPSIQQVVSLVQKFQIKASKQLYYEADVMEVFYKPIRSKVSDTYELRRSSRGLMLVFLVATPVCIHCKFVRRPEKEVDKNQVYSWGGYAFTLLQEEEEDGLEDVKPPTQVANDEWI